MIERRLEESSDIREENRELVRKHGLVESETCRLSFFSASLRSVSSLDSVANDFLGYAVVKKDRFTGSSQARIFESVIRPPGYSNLYIRGSQKWTIKVRGRKFDVWGYLYAQQNGKTNCCAHVAARTVLARFIPDGEFSYAAMNRFLKLKNPSEGLEANQLVALLTHCGISCSLADFTRQPNKIRTPSFVKFVYGSIESGFPAILYFGASSRNSYHAVPVFGHTFCRNNWVPNAESSYFTLRGAAHLPSDSWLDHMIAHDDNCGSHLCIPRHFLSNAKPRRVDTRRKPASQRQVNDTRKVVYAIGALPKEIVAPPLGVEVMAARFIYEIFRKAASWDYVKSEISKQPWYCRSKEYFDQGRLVLRPILVTADEYIDHLEKVSDWANEQLPVDDLGVLRMYLRQESRYLWMVEISLPELFPTNHRKLGEILFRSDIPLVRERGLEAFVLARMPGFYTWPYDREADGVGLELEFFPNSVNAHVELYGCEARGHTWSNSQGPAGKMEKASSQPAGA